LRVLAHVAQLSVAPLLANAILRVHLRQSVSAVFQKEAKER
jgi:hypothetical protein